ncbi:RodZ domain-containing protein [uncultured Selenomonas sp.]|uniref:helix-turn-helix domain-containing protein n=1 Tax=uncultured Selenomonas sp. TaxID=159275 RepID=UPI0028E992F8|nr:RodZ domain-containing protein [uncultured Selenomonas sp.]
MVGDILRREREKQGLTIADIEKGTSIRGLYIEHIERGNIAELPGLVYAKGFVRNYAKFLNLDAEPLVQQFAEENGSMSAPAPPPTEAPPRRISLSNVGDESLSQISIGSSSSSYAGIFGKLAVGIIVLVALVGGGAAVISAINSSVQETPQAPSVKTEQPATASAAAEADASDAARTAANADGVRVSVTLSERCWTEVSVDGKEVFEGIIESGKTESWQGRESVVVRAGNASALDVTFNGKKLGKFGENGEVVERRFTKTTKDLKDTLLPAPARAEKSSTSDKKDSKSTKDAVNTQ